MILYFSPRFKEQLKSILDNKIAKEILDNEGSNIDNNVTFIDINEYDDNYLTFMPIDHAQKLINSYHPGVGDADVITSFNLGTNDALWRNRVNSKVAPVYNGGSRNSIKIGKFANKILKNKYKSTDIERFVNLFKSSSPYKREYIEIVDGKDIEYWYNENNYLYKQGTLGSSCMANKKGFFDIYINNKETCKLVILKLGNRIVARSLLWKINKISSKDEKEKGKINTDWFLDRVYANEDYQIEKIRQWAIKKGYAIKYYSSYGYSDVILYNNLKYDNTKIRVKVIPDEYNKYPYLDTLTRYDSKRGLLYNDERLKLGGHILRSTGGGYSRESISRSKAFFNRIINIFKSNYHL